MEILRVSRNAWGQEVLQGVSWDLLWVFVGAGIAFIVGHLIYSFICAKKKQKS